MHTLAGKTFRGEGKHMEMSATALVERLKGAAARVGTRGVRLVVEGTVAAMKTVDRLQELLPNRERVPQVTREPARGAAEVELERPTPAEPVRSHPARVLPQARATARRVLAEVHAVEQRLKGARPAPRPLKVSAAQEETPTGPKRRSGRKTRASATAPKHAKEKASEPGTDFKAKRGQKHGH
jgi:hypothetical protein